MCAVTSAAWGVPGGAVSENGRLCHGDGSQGRSELPEVVCVAYPRDWVRRRFRACHVDLSALSMSLLNSLSFDASLFF